jgi:hypothetical protein
MRESPIATRLPAVNRKLGSPAAVRIALSAIANCGTSAEPNESALRLDAMLCGSPMPISSSYRVHDVKRRKSTPRRWRTVASGRRLVVDCATERWANTHESTSAPDRMRCRTDNRKSASAVCETSPPRYHSSEFAIKDILTHLS